MCTAKAYITAMLPSNYEYKFDEIDSSDIDANNFTTSFKMMKNLQESRSRTIMQQPDKPCNKKQAGKHVVRKLYLRYLYKQRHTGKHTKSDRVLKTTHRQHNTGCPAQIILTILVPHKHHHGKFS